MNGIITVPARRQAPLAKLLIKSAFAALALAALTGMGGAPAGADELKIIAIQQAQIQKLTQEMAVVHSELKATHQQIDSLNSSVSTLQEAFAAAQHRIMTLTAANAGMRQVIDSQAQDLSQARAAIGQKIDQISDLSARLANTSQDLASARSLIDQFQATVYLSNGQVHQNMHGNVNIFYPHDWIVQCTESSCEVYHLSEGPNAPKLNFAGS